jgi:hypothetical protein
MIVCRFKLRELETSLLILGSHPEFKNVIRQRIVRCSTDELADSSEHSVHRLFQFEVVDSVKVQVDLKFC